MCTLNYLLLCRWVTAISMWQLEFDIIIGIPSSTKGIDLHLPSNDPETTFWLIFFVVLFFICHCNFGMMSHWHIHALNDSYVLSWRNMLIQCMSLTQVLVFNQSMQHMPWQKSYPAGSVPYFT